MRDLIAWIPAMIVLAACAMHEDPVPDAGFTLASAYEACSPVDGAQDQCRE